MVSNGEYLKLIKLYNSKFRRLPRQNFCEVIDVKEQNFLSYNNIILILEENGILKEIIDGENRRKIILLDRNKLESFIRKSDFYKLVENFIHNSNRMAIT